MKHSKLLLLVLFLFHSIFNSYSQIWLNDEDIYNEAQEYLHGEEYEEALPLLMLLEKKGILNSHISYKIGKCLLNISGKQTHSIPYLESAIENTGQDIKNSLVETRARFDAYLLLAIAYRTDYKFDKAKSVLQEYKGKVDDADTKTLIDYHLSICNNAISMHENPNDIEFLMIEYNGTYSLYNPLLVSDNKVFYMEKRPFYDAIMEGEINDNKLINMVNLTPRIKSDGNHTLVNSSKSGDTLLLIAYQAESGYDLFYAIRKHNEWNEYVRFQEPVNSPQYETFACLSPNGKTLYFCSNRPGGIGGTDIYVSEIGNDGTWGEPRNIGNRINTSLNEASVFVSSDNNKLFFSSEGHLSMGGSDYYVSIRDKSGEWGLPVNLGSPVSTPGEDIFLAPENSENGFITYRIDKTGSNNYKIYRLEITEDLFSKKIMIKGQLEFSDSLTAKSIPFSVWNMSDSVLVLESKTDNQGIFSYLISPGKYSVDYKYSDQVYAHQKITIDEGISLNELFLTEPDWMIHKTIDINNLVIISLQDILFKFDSYNIAKKYFGLLDSLVNVLNKNPDILVSISGFTDARGPDNYNRNLSMKRAKQVEAYLYSKGIVKSRISTYGKGEISPVALNLNTDGSDNPLGRSYNRRVRIDLINIGNNIQIQRIDIVPKEIKIK